MSDLGGIFGIFSMFFAFFVGWYNSKVYQIEAVTENFKVRTNSIKDLKKLQDAPVLGKAEVGYLIASTTSHPLSY